SPANCQRQSIAVWSLNLYELTASKMFHGVKLVTSPAAMNPNLHAQEGVFTTWPEKLDWKKGADGRPLDEVLENLLRRCSKATLFHKFTLPLSQAPRLLEICFGHGFNAARLFPGFNGAARHLSEAALLRTVISDAERRPMVPGNSING